MFALCLALVRTSHKETSNVIAIGLPSYTRPHQVDPYPDLSTLATPFPYARDGHGPLVIVHADRAQCARRLGAPERVVFLVQFVMWLQSVMGSFNCGCDWLPCRPGHISWLAHFPTDDSVTMIAGAAQLYNVYSSRGTLRSKQERREIHEGVGGADGLGREGWGVN